MEQISVIIPTFNRSEMLIKAVDSVIRQHSFCGEIIVIDDGSTDTTAERLSPYRDQGVRYIYQQNSGAAAARNRGVVIAQHDVIAFLDSDDHWEKNKLSRQWEHLNNNPDFAICHTREKWLRRGQHLNQRKIHQPGQGDIFAHCLKICAVGMSTVMMKKKLFETMGGFDESLPCCEDYDLWLRTAASYPFLLLDEPLTVKEGGREDQLSWKYRVGMDVYRIYAIEKLLQSGQLSEEHLDLARAELQRKCRIYGNGCIKHGKTEQGHYYLGLAEKYQKQESR